MIDPTCDRQWQEAVDSAWAHLLLEDARKYGLVRGGPEVNVVRCREILDRGKQRGIVPSHQAVDKAVAEWSAVGGRG